MMHNVKIFFLSAAFGVGMIVPALAQDVDMASGKKSDWNYLIGGGAMVAPTYEGSKHYEVNPLPLAEVSWRDAISLGTKDGLKVLVKPLMDRNFSVNGAVGYWGGRREGVDKDHGDTLRGLGNLSGGAVGKLGLDYRIQALDVGLDLARDLGNDRDGTTVTMKSGYKILNNSRFHLDGVVSTTWADDNYMSNMFGITQAQARTSLKHYSAYSAGAGIKDVTAGFNANYDITSAISLFGLVKMSRLLDDAADSPIVKTQGSDNQFGASIGLAYRF
jgi:outer membrane scaffolding protein for murein synthesis (MipA/OmpV family)